MIASILLALLLATGGGTAYAAEHALPGDTLYPIKVSVNEPVREALILNAENKADWILQRAERRLDEMSELAAAGKLTLPVADKLTVNFEKQLAKAKEKAATFTANGKLNAAEQMLDKAQAILAAHEAYLKKININTIPDEIKKEADKLAAQKDEILKKVEAAKADMEEAANGAKGAAENKLAEVRKFIENRADKVVAEAVKKAQDILAAAETLRSQANEKMTSKDFGAAFKLYHEAMRKAQDAKAELKINELEKKVEAAKVKAEEKEKAQEEKIKMQEEKAAAKEVKQKEKEQPKIGVVQVETAGGGAVTVTQTE
jgi:predicted phage tail protein